MLKFFPYRRDYCTDTFTVKNNFAGGWAMTSKCFPTGLSQAPFRWAVLGPEPRRQYEMEFVGGFVGVRQSPANLTLRPEVGWAVIVFVEGAADPDLLKRQVTELLECLRAAGIGVGADVVWPG